MVLAEAGGTPNARVALVSNPLDPAQWSDEIADEIDIDFAWLDSPDYTDELKRARERLTATVQHHVETQRERELHRIIADVFEKNGIVDEHEPITDPALQQKITDEITHRFVLHKIGLPYIESVTGQDIVTRLKAIRARKG
jgi:hypothetical protein